MLDCRAGTAWLSCLNFRRFTVLVTEGMDDVGMESVALSGRVVVLLALVCNDGGIATTVSSSGGLSCLIAVSEGIVSGTEFDLDKPGLVFFSLLSPSSIFLFLRPGLAGLMGGGSEDEVDDIPSGLTEQKIHGS